MLREPELVPVEDDAGDGEGDPDGLIARAAAAYLQEGEHSEGAMVALYPDPATAAAVALDGGEDPDELHITLAFLGKAASLDREGALSAVRAFAAGCPPLEGEISGVGHFVGGPDPVTYLSVDLPELPHQRETLVSFLDGAGVPAKTDHGFTPHLTLDYASRRPKIDKPIPLTFSRVTLTWGDERIEVPFTGTALEESLVQHAETEIKKAALDSPESDYEGMLGNEILRIVRTFSEAGHSGGSAAMTIAALEKLLRYEPLTPLTSDPDEWMQVQGPSTQFPESEDLWQSRRNPAAFSKDGGATWELMEAAQLLEGKWDPTLHPRWPKGTPKAGEFIKVGDHFISSDGKEWQVAHIAGGKVIAHRAGGKLNEVETGVFNPTKVSGAKSPLPQGAETHVIADATKEAAPKPLTGGSGGKGLGSGVATVDPYVDSSTHDAAVTIPETSKINEEEWQRFGNIDQEHYAELMGRFGKYSPSKAKSLIDESYNDYEAEIQSIVKNAYTSQYGASTGFTLSLASIFNHFKKPNLAKIDTQRKRALELQGRHKDVVAWDLYNRTHSPDIAVFHKNTEAPSYWQQMIGGKKPIMSGLSQSFNFGANFQFGNNTLATPLAIRHVLMSSYSAQPIPGQSHFAGELEIATAEQLKLNKRSMIFSLHDLTANQQKWLMGVTKAPTGGATLERFREALESGEMLPTPPAPPDVQMQGEAKKLWIDPPAEAAAYTKGFAAKLPELQGNPVNPSDLDKSGPWAYKDAAGNPMPTVAKESELKPGDYMMGLKGTLYVVIEDPGDSTGFGLRYVKIEHGQFTGESYNFEGGGGNNYYKLDQHYDLPDPHKEQQVSELFDPNGWVNGEKEAFTGELAPKEKFKVNGTPYEVVGQLNKQQTQIKDLTDGKIGTINTDYKTAVLEPKAGYVPDAAEETPKLTPAKGMTLAYNGEKFTVTNVLKGGTVKAKPSGGKTVAIAPDDPALDGLYDPKAHVIGAKIKAGDLAVGSLFHGGRGSAQRPYRVTGAEGNKVTWESLDTGESGVFTKAKVVRSLDSTEPKATAAAEPVADESPVAAAAHNPDEWEGVGEHPVGEIGVGEKFNWNGDDYELKGFYKGTASAEKLSDGSQSYFPEDATVGQLVPKSEIDPADLEAPPLEPGQPAQLGELKPGDAFAVDGEHFVVTHEPVTLEDNVGVAPIMPSGEVGADTENGAYPGKIVTFKGSNVEPKQFAQTQAPAPGAYPDLEMEGGFAAFKSKYGSGGKYTHDKIGEMTVGTVFVDKKGDAYKVKAAGSEPLVTDGKTVFQADPGIRGKVSDAQFVDESAPLPGPSTTAQEADAASGLTDNWPGLKVGELPAGSKALVTGHVHTIKSYDPADGYAVTTLPDGSNTMLGGDLVPDKVSAAAKPPQTVGTLEPGDDFASGLTQYEVVAHSSNGSVVKSKADGTLKQVPSNTPWEEVGADKPDEESAKPEQALADLQPGEVFEGAGGTLHEVLAKAVDGDMIVHEQGTNAEGISKFPDSTKLNAVGHATPAPTPAGAVSAPNQWSPVVQDVLDSASAKMSDVPVTGVSGYQSKWGSGGKYQHYRIEELEPGDLFKGKDGHEWWYIGAGDNGHALIKDPDHGDLYLAASTTRVRRLG